MNTTTAAAQAGVTSPTIRRWCRHGVVAAAKRAGRWVIEAASLAYRITLGKETRMETTPAYQVIESTNRYGTTVYKVVRTDGATNDFRIDGATYAQREHAEFHAEFVNRTPSEYRVKREFHRARSIQSGHYWQIKGGRNGDPLSVNATWNDGAEVHGNWPEGTTPVDVLISITLLHDKGAEARIAKKAEAAAVAAAEAAVSEARQAQLVEAEARKGALATPRQVEYILQLLEARKFSGEGGGFFSGPTTRAGIEELSKTEASMYITSLKGDY